MSEVLYRKWRPQTFEEIAGQEPVTRTLRNSIDSGRLAHAYLFCGPRGTGKTSLGRLLAKAANCASTREGEPCNACDSCVAFSEGRAVDFVEQDAASHNSVDDIRQLRENVVLTPMSGQLKVYLLDEVHMLSNSAENALLKTLEEPPPHIIFVLATTEPHKVSATIISRCQRFDLRRIPASAVIDRLTLICEKEGFSLEPAALEEIARAATGSLRDAINALEQVVTYYGRSPSFDQVQEALGLRVDARSGQLARLAIAGDLTEALRLLAGVRDDGADMRQFCKQIVRYLRGLLLAKAGASESLDLPREMAEDVKSEAVRISREDIVRALRAFARVDFREDAQSPLPLELALVELASETRPGSAERTTSAPTPEPPKPQPAASAVEKNQVASPPPADAPEPRDADLSPAEEQAPQVSPPGDGPAAAEPPSDPPQPAPLAPQPEPSAPEPPVPAPSAASGGDDLLQQVRVLAKDSDRQLSALLNGSCEVKSVDSDQVVLGFYHTFHLERVEGGPYAQRLQELFSNVMGKQVKVNYEHAPRTQPRPQVKGGHLVEAARELGARPVDGPSAGEGGQSG